MYNAPIHCEALVHCVHLHAAQHSSPSATPHALCIHNVGMYMLGPHLVPVYQELLPVPQKGNLAAEELEVDAIRTPGSQLMSQ